MLKDDKSPTILERPVKRIRAIIDRLPTFEKWLAKQVIYNAKSLSRPELQQAVYKFESVAKNANYV